MSHKINVNKVSLGKEVKLDYYGISSQIKFLQGKILTIIEATYTNEIQSKAIKDLIKGVFNNQLSYIGDICFPECGMTPREAVESMGVDVDKLEVDGEIQI